MLFGFRRPAAVQSHPLMRAFSTLGKDEKSKTKKAAGADPKQETVIDVQIE